LRRGYPLLKLEPEVKYLRKEFGIEFPSPFQIKHVKEGVLLQEVRKQFKEGMKETDSTKINDRLDKAFDALRILNSKSLALSEMCYSNVSEAETNGVLVKIQSSPAGLESANVQTRHFRYSVYIKNMNTTKTIQLRERHWIILDANGKKEEVKGKGVLDRMPILKPGQAFEYDSYLALDTYFGTLKGSYGLIDVETGEKFDAKVKPVGLLGTYTQTSSVASQSVM